MQNGKGKGGGIHVVHMQLGIGLLLKAAFKIQYFKLVWEGVAVPAGAVACFAEFRVTMLRSRGQFCSVHSAEIKTIRSV